MKKHDKKKQLVDVSNELKKVGSIQITGSKKRFSYSEVEYDNFGWADSSKYLPLDYDLVEVKNKENKVFSGWIIGIKWEGYRIQEGINLTHWRRADHGCKERQQVRYLIS